MDHKLANSQEAESRFWERYINFLSNQGVNANARRWYVSRAGLYLNEYEEKDPGQHTPGTSRII